MVLFKTFLFGPRRSATCVTHSLTYLCLILAITVRVHVSAVNHSDVKFSRTSWPRGQSFVFSLGLGLEECPRPRAFVLGVSSNFLLWPRENECNDGTGRPNHCEFAVIIYQSYLLTYLVLLI